MCFNTTTVKNPFYSSTCYGSFQWGFFQQSLNRPDFCLSRRSQNETNPLKRSRSRSSTNGVTRDALRKSDKFTDFHLPVRAKRVKNVNPRSTRRP